MDYRLLTFPREALNCCLDKRVGIANNSNTLSKYAQPTPAGEPGRAVKASDRRRRSNGPRKLSGNRTVGR